MPIDTTSPRSRRALLTAAVGGAAAAAAASVTRVAPVAGANDQPVLIGKGNTGTRPTNVVSSGNGTLALGGVSTGAGGFGVVGRASTGVGVHGDTDGGGYALATGAGRVRFAQVSGVATIARGNRSVTLKPGVDINPKTFVLLTPMANLGSRALWFTKSNKRDSITIRMSSTRGAPTKIAWLALERA